MIKKIDNVMMKQGETNPLKLARKVNEIIDKINEKEINLENINLDLKEIVEKKTLSDKITREDYNANEKILVRDVKESLKEFIVWLLTCDNYLKKDLTQEDIWETAKEIFGESLIK